jgi:hypothetical protein
MDAYENLVACGTDKALLIFDSRGADQLVAKFDVVPNSIYPIESVQFHGPSNSLFVLKGGRVEDGCGLSVVDLRKLPPATESKDTDDAYKLVLGFSSGTSLKIKDQIGSSSPRSAICFNPVSRCLNFILSLTFRHVC